MYLSTNLLQLINNNFSEIVIKILILTFRTEIDGAMSAQTKRGLMMMSTRDGKPPPGRQLPQKRNNYAVSIQESNDAIPFSETQQQQRPVPPVISQVKSSDLSISQGTPTSQVTVVENKRQTPTVTKSNRLMMMTTNSRPPLMKKPKEVKFFNNVTAQSLIC